ncbi:MAG: aminoglycoside phosphotransferase family protein [Acidimicrobiia bacterium]
MNGSPVPVASQQTSTETREREIALVRSLAGLRDDDFVEVEDEGWDSRVYVVNRGEVVFKFPRTAEAQAAYADEIAILRVMSGGDGRVVVPTLEWVGPEQSYLGYRGIVGRQLGRIGGPLADGELRRIGRDLGAFLVTLHATDLTGFDVDSVDDEISQFARKFDASRDAIEPEFSRAEWNRLVEFFSTRLPETMRALGSEPRVCHADLGRYNLILGQDGRLGVIDFGDVGVFDASKDFMGLDGAMLDAALAEYDGSDALPAKVEIRRLALPILDLPFYLGKGDVVGVAECIERLRRSFR